MIARRGFIAGLAASLFAAPAIVRAASLMPVRSIVLPGEPEWDLMVVENLRGEELARFFSLPGPMPNYGGGLIIKKLRSLVRLWDTADYDADLRADIAASFRVAA